MIVTKEWLNEFIDISNVSLEQICKTFNSIGLEVDSDKTFKIPAKIVVGFVQECAKHPDADKLSVCKVDIGSEVAQIVCGASNVAAGQFVPVATIGADMGEGFIIKKAKLRGVESSGMICSSTELGLPKINDGIMVLDDSIGELILGKQLSEYSLLNDSVIEIELTANRGDCLSILGVARELSVMYKTSLNKFEPSVVYGDLSIGQILDIKISKQTQSNLIYIAANIDTFRLPLLHKLRCAIIDKIAINDVMIFKNYLEHSIGSIFNIYPRSTICGLEEICSIEISQNDVGLDVVKSGIAELGVVGVRGSAFEDFGTEIIIEASYIEPEVVSKKVFESKIKTGESYYKSSRGSNPDLKMSMGYCKNYLSLCGAKLYKGSEEFCDEKEATKLDVSISKLGSIIGQEISKPRVENILLALGFVIRDSGEDMLSVKIPYFRHDIKNIADIAEEIVRVIGIDNIKAKPLIFEEINRKNSTSNFYDLKNSLRNKSVAQGFFETITYAFTSRELLVEFGFDVVEASKDLANPITSELNTFRTTLLLNLLQATSNNTKFGYKKIAFFEIGKVFDSLRNESTKITFVFSGNKESESFTNSGKPKNIDFFDFAQKIANVIGKFDITPIDTIPNNIIHPYQNGLITQNGMVIGYIAKLHPNVAQKFDLDDTMVCEIDFDKLMIQNVKAVAISKFQAVRRDLSILTPKQLPFCEIKTVLDSIDLLELKSYNLVDIYSDEKLGNNESLTFRFVLQSELKTLEEDDISNVMNTILSSLQEKLNLNIR